MNLGLVTSFIIAGILLLSILSMNNNVAQSSTELTMRQIMQQRATNISDLLKNDFLKLGYQSEESPPISTAEFNEVKFTCDLNDDGNEDTITWTYDNTEQTLTRYVSYESEPTIIRSGVTKFYITYLDSAKDSLANPGSVKDQIQHFKVSLTLTSPEPVGSNGNEPNYIKTNWERTFTPVNLTL